MPHTFHHSQSLYFKVIFNFVFMSSTIYFNSFLYRTAILTVLIQYFLRSLLCFSVPPSFVVKPVNTSIVQHDALLLHCRATGSPVPRLLWWKDGIPVNSSRITLHPNGTLSIPSTHVQDSGKFSCEAQNVAGKITGSAYVAIYGK